MKKIDSQQNQKWEIFISNLVPKCATNCACVVNMADTTGSLASKAEQCASEGVNVLHDLIVYMISVGHFLSLLVRLPTYINDVHFYLPHSSISFLHLLSFLLCFSLSIRKHSGLMVGLKLRYKAIRQSMHFWLQCAFTPRPRAHKDSSSLYRSLVVLPVTLNNQFVRDRTSVLLI